MPFYLFFRAGVPDVMVIITDGIEETQSYETMMAAAVGVAQQISITGVKIFGKGLSGPYWREGGGFGGSGGGGGSTGGREWKG